MMMKKQRVLFVCLGNICRSPTAHGIFQKMVDDNSLSEQIFVDSAGTSGWHIGAPPDKRTSAAAKQQGYDLSSLRGRKFVAEDFNQFDYLLAMDSNNFSDMKALMPSNFSGHCSLFLDFSSQNEISEVPDPYYGGDSGFQTVLELVEDGCRGLLDHITQRDL